MLQSRNHGSNDNTTSREVAKSLQPTHVIVLECIPLEKGHVESVCVVDKLLKVLQGNLGNEGRAPQVDWSRRRKGVVILGICKIQMGNTPWSPCTSGCSRVRENARDLTGDSSGMAAKGGRLAGGGDDDHGNLVRLEMMI
jgi:hypothetical protein